MENKQNLNSLYGKDNLGGNKMKNTNTFMIDKMDWEYIVSTIRLSLLDDYSKKEIHSMLYQGFKLSDMVLDYLLIAIKHNNQLTPNYKNHLMNVVKEMNGGLNE